MSVSNTSIMTGRSTATHKSSGRRPHAASRLSCCLKHLISVTLFLVLASAGGADDQIIDLSSFRSGLSAAELPADWEPLNFPKIDSVTRYEVVEDPTYGPVIEAHSDGGAGAIVRPVLIDPRHYPLLSWYWKIDQTLPGSSLVDKEGDDFPVRLMVSFGNSAAGDNGFTKSGFQDKTICYVWTAADPVDTFAENPHHDSVVTVVAADGSSSSGSWRAFSRDIVKDYKRAFSEEPGMITGVALMTDSDNTGSRITAWYGPISLSAHVADN